MSTLIHATYTETAGGIAIAVKVFETYPGCHVVTCTGPLVGHECSGRADVLIEPGDTWETAEAAIEFSEMHAREHHERGRA